MSGSIRVLLININMSIMFCWSLVSNYYIHFNLQRSALATSSSASSLASSLINSLASSLASSSISSLASSLISLGCKYSFTIVVLKSVSPLISYTLHISPSIPSNLTKPVHLPLYPILPFYYISIYLN